jgi:hypothetical protein
MEGRRASDLDEILIPPSRFCTASARRQTIFSLMDILAVAIGIAAFVLLLALIEGLDRV